MTKWEYKRITSPDRVKELGLEGWELVTVIVVNGTERFYLKRPIEELKQE